MASLSLGSNAKDIWSCPPGSEVHALAAHRSGPGSGFWSPDRTVGFSSGTVVSAHRKTTETRPVCICANERDLPGSRCIFWGEGGLLVTCIVLFFLLLLFILLCL